MWQPLIAAVCRHNLHFGQERHEVITSSDFKSWAVFQIKIVMCISLQGQLRQSSGKMQLQWVMSIKLGITRARLTHSSKISRQTQRHAPRSLNGSCQLQLLVRKFGRSVHPSFRSFNAHIIGRSFEV